MSTNPENFFEPGIGDVLAGRYRLEKELGRGGFGIVFRGTHLDTQRTVAVKILLATNAQSDSKAVERFRREAILSASLEYPNTVDVFDYGETEHGVFFLVMEYLRGTPLVELIEFEAPLAPHRIVHITRQILYALMEAHSKGIVHRDIKPENIMIVPLLYDTNYVKVMDFGIAKMVSGGPQITQAGQTFGTPRYMAPEQLQGDEATPSTDLYALGLVIYEMFTGRPAIDSQNLATTITQVIFGPPITLDEFDHVPPEFQSIVRRACGRDTENRFENANQMLEALANWSGPSPEALASVAMDALGGPPTVPPPPGSGPASGFSRPVTHVIGPDEVSKRLEAINDPLSTTLHEEGAPPPAPVLAPSSPGQSEAAPSDPTISLRTSQDPFDPQQTSLVPTHADAGQAPAATMMVDSEVIQEQLKEPKSGFNLKSGCVIALLLTVIVLCLVVTGLLLVVMDVI